MSMQHPYTSDPGLSEIGTAIPDWRPQDVTPVAHGVREAAVALVFRTTPDPELLLIRRSKSESDPWSGHMALPGGRKEEDDASLLHTAVRETHEETGVDLSGSALLGRLDLVAPLGARLPKFSVTPLVFGIAGSVQARAASNEVARVHWVGLSELQDAGSRETTTILLPDGPREFPAFRLDGQIVWGLTHRILDRLVRRLGGLPIP